MSAQPKPRKRRTATRASTSNKHEVEQVVEPNAAKLVHAARQKLPHGSYVVKALKGKEAFEAAVAAGIFTPTGRLAKAYTSAQTRARRFVP